MIGPVEIMVILLVALLLFGPEQLSEFAVKFGRWYRTTMKASEELNRQIREFEREATKAMDLPEGSLRNPVDLLGSLTPPANSEPAELTIPSPPPPERMASDTVRDTTEAVQDTTEAVQDASEAVETAPELERPSGLPPGAAADGTAQVQRDSPPPSLSPGIDSSMPMESSQTSNL